MDKFIELLIIITLFLLAIGALTIIGIVIYLLVTQGIQAG